MHKLLFAAGSRVNLAPMRVSTTVTLEQHGHDSHARYHVTVFYDQLLKKKKKGERNEISLLHEESEMNRVVSLSRRFSPLQPGFD